MAGVKALMIKDLPRNELPREKLLANGAKSLSDAELLAILLRTGTREDSVLRVAEKLLSCYKESGLVGIAHLSPRDLSKVKGIGMVKAVTVLAALELGIRLAQYPTSQRIMIRSPQDVASFIMPRLRYEDKEQFLILLLNTKNHVLAAPIISIGSLNASIVHPREVFKAAVDYSAASIILVHNHPSGDPSPSKEDVLITNKLLQAGNIMDIRVLDHIIIGDNRYISLREIGQMSD